MSLTMLDLNSEARTYNSEPLPPLRPIWIGFVLAFGFLVLEIAEVASGDTSGKVGVLGTLISIACWIYWLSCVQRFHTILNQLAPYAVGQSTYPITPGRAVGYHFIPFYNFYWIFKWPLEISRFVQESSSVPMISGAVPGLFLFLGLVLARLFDGFVGFSLIFGVGLYISRKLRRVMAEHERTRGVAEVFT
jgi:hypothetical protein